MGQFLSIITNKLSPSVEQNELKLPNDKANLELMKPYILNLCKNYLSGVWEQVELYDFTIYKPW